MSADYCENFKALAMQSQPIDRKRVFVRLRCKMWTCEFCAAKNRQIWRATLIHHINLKKGAWCWFTLTAHRYARGELKSLDNLRGAWDKLMKRMKRKFGKFDYARVYERHADGSYHIHAIASFNFDDIKTRRSKKDGKETSYSSWLQKTAWGLGLGMYTHAANVEAIFQNHGGFVASYVTKYIVKISVDDWQQLKRVRHIQVSQGWTRKKADIPPSDWQFKFGVYYPDVVEAMGSYALVDSGNGHMVTVDDFEDTYIYPPDFS